MRRGGEHKSGVTLLARAAGQGSEKKSRKMKIISWFPVKSEVHIPCKSAIYFYLFTLNRLSHGDGRCKDVYFSVVSIMKMINVGSAKLSVEK